MKIVRFKLEAWTQEYVELDPKALGLTNYNMTELDHNLFNDVYYDECY